MTLAANSEGQVQGWFTIPPGVPHGTKLVHFQGAQTEAFGTFVGRGVLKIEDLRAVNTQILRRTLTWNGDPLAQTFILPEGAPRQVAAVDLWFAAIGTTNVLIQIREVMLGIPSLDVVAETLLAPAELTLSGPTRFRFPPVLLEAGREYALVVACNDAVSALWTGGIGEFDAFDQSWVTAQPYQIGVLLSSSNNRTWTPHQTKDLTFRLLAADYDVETNLIEQGETTRVVALAPASVVDADHLMILAAVERPTADCDVVFRLVAGGNTYTVVEGQPLTLPVRYTGEVSMEAELRGTFTASPRLYRDVALIAGTRGTAGTYVSRAMQTYSDGANPAKITMYYDVSLPGTSSVDAYYELSADNWVALPVVDGMQLGDGWQEVRREITGFEGAETRVKLVLNGSAVFRPRVANLRVAIT